MAMTVRQHGWIAGGVAVLLVLLIAWMWLQSPPQEKTASPGDAGPKETPVMTRSEKRDVPRTGAGTDAAGLRSQIEQVLAKLQRGEAAAGDLEALRKSLLGADPQVAIGVMREFLHTGKDAPASGEFTVGEGGTLASATTLRVFLLDLLGQVARTAGSGAADEYAREVLQTKTSPEEWALSLRNVAWSEPGAKAYVGSKVREMLSDPKWSATPSGGYLEAFDALVWTGDPAFVEPLAGMIAGNSLPLQRASLIAMDRLAENNPLAVMEYLNSNPTVLSDRPFNRADYFAKADLAQPNQQVALESYLDRVDVSPEEKSKLLARLPVGASFVSNSLINPPPAPTNGVAQQKVALTAMQAWLKSNRFPTLNTALQSVLSRFGK